MYLLWMWSPNLQNGSWGFSHSEVSLCFMYLFSSNYSNLFETMETFGIFDILQQEFQLHIMSKSLSLGGGVGCLHLLYTSYNFIEPCHSPLSYLLSSFRNPGWLNCPCLTVIAYFSSSLLPMMPRFQFYYVFFGFGITGHHISVSLHLFVFFPISFQTIGCFCLVLFLTLWGTELTF